MSITADNLQKLQQDLHVELVTANELLLSISEEVQKIKSITSQGGELESTIKQNASLMANLADMQKLDITKLPPVARTLMNLGQQANQNTSMDEQSQ